MNLNLKLSFLKLYSNLSCINFKFYCKFNCKFYCSYDPSLRHVIRRSVWYRTAAVYWTNSHRITLHLLPLFVTLTNVSANNHPRASTSTIKCCYDNADISSILFRLPISRTKKIWHTKVLHIFCCRCNGKISVHSYNRGACLLKSRSPKVQK